MVVGVAILHPGRPELELLSPGAVLDATILAHLARLGVAQVWLRHDGLEELDQFVSPQLQGIRRSIYVQIKRDFSRLEQASISTARIQDYRQTMMALVCELIGNHRVVGLTEQLFSGKSSLFSHCANVAFLATLLGLELEPYIVTERKKLSIEHARDLPTLGLGAMLHDLGKTALSPALRARHEVHDPWLPRDREDYQEHALRGYVMLRGSRAPASATQAVLNHHQRFDGTGWPDMSAVTRRRQVGPQAGRQIHIFTRIVAVANVLENLMHEFDGSHRPPVAALHDLADPRFDGWFDPIVRQVALRRIPPFQVGSLVTLSDGRQAAVLAPSLRQPCRPDLRVLSGSDRSAKEHNPVLRLELEPALRIVRCAGVNVEPWLFELPTRPANSRVTA